MIKEVGLEIPDSAAALIDAGTLVRTDGILRDADTMAIVKHLKIVDLDDKTCWQELGNAISRVIKENKTGAIVAASVIAVIGVTIGVVAHYKRKKRKELEEKCNAWLNRVIKNYTDAAKNGSLDIDTISACEDALTSLPQLTDKVFISMTKDQILDFAAKLHEYTTKLAEVNNWKITDPASIEYQGNVVTLMINNLRVQKEILKKCA